MSTAPPAVSAGDYFNKRVKHTMASELADLAWDIHKSLGEVELGKTAKKIEDATLALQNERERLAELATMLTEQAAEIDPLSA